MPPESLQQPTGAAADMAPAPRPQAHPGVLAALGLGLSVLAALAATTTADVHAQACPPYCATPIITPAWHLHMCDMSYQEQLADNHCMIGPGITEFSADTRTVYIIYCHKYTDTVVVQVRDSGGGQQFVNHPDGITYEGDACETLEFSRPNGIAPGGSPYITSAYWPEGPFSGVSPGVEWFIGLFIAFDEENYYGNDAQAHITVRDPGANSSPLVLDEITVTVTSDSDPVGIPVLLREEHGGFSVFKSVQPVRFSQIASNPAQGILKVQNRDTITATYCARDCSRPYIDTATWYSLSATITPTPLPTWPGPPPTVTPTPPADLRVEYISLRPGPLDVGYAPEITNLERPNHLGYPDMFVGMWTRGKNAHFGMAQFDLSPLPEGAQLIDARLELVGRNSRLMHPGQWKVMLLSSSIDPVWRDATYDQLASQATLGQIGATLRDSDLAAGRRNALGFTSSQLGWIDERVRTTRRLSFRVDGPTADDNLFSWETGVDVYGRASSPPDPSLGPVLNLSYVVPGGGSGSPSPTSTGPAPSATASASSGPPIGSTATPTPTAGSTPTHSSAAATATAGGATLTPASTATPPASVTAGVTLTPSPTPPSSATSGSTPTVGPPSTPGGQEHTATSTVTPGGPTLPASGTPAPDPDTPTPSGANGPPTATPEGPLVGRQVCVIAFNDTNADGARQAPHERLLAGVTLRLTHQETGAFVTWTTDAANEPDHCWAGLTDGAYRFRVVELPRDYEATGHPERQLHIPMSVASVQYEFGAIEGGIPTATPTASPVPPTHTPRPVDLTATAQAAAEPTERPTPTPQPTVDGPSGLLCIGVFRDRNADGFREPGEGLLADVQLVIQDDQRQPIRTLLSLVEGPVCSQLPVGVYYAVARQVPGYEPTTVLEQVVLLTQGDQVLVEFGQRARGVAIYVPHAATSRRR